MRRGRRIRTILLLLVVALLVATAAVLLLARDDARAWRQAIVVGGIARGTQDTGARIARTVGGDVRPVAQREVGGLPATVILPRGEGRVPAVVVVVPSGTGPEEERRIADLQRGLAAAGIAGWAVRVPAEDDLIDDPTAVLAGVVETIAADPATHAGRVSVLASGPAASIVLARAARDWPGVDLRAVVAVEPIADLRALVRDALVGATVDPELRVRVGRLLARAARDEVGSSGATIAAAVLDGAASADDPIAQLRRIPARAATGRVGLILAVLQAPDEAAFDAAWSSLPEDLRARVAAVSPQAVAASIDARVLVVDVAGAGADELGDGRALVDALPDARRLRVAADGELPPTRELLSLSAWWLLRAGA